MTLEIRRPVLRYYGGGWKRAEWTVSHMPAHTVYCEPCFGSGAVLLRKPMAKLEVANDIDARVMNFFEVLHTRTDELVYALDLTPWHEAEFWRCLQLSADALEDARRFFFTSWASVKGGPISGASDFRWQKKQTRRSAAVKDTDDLSHLFAAAKRLKNVQFLCRDGLSVIEKMRGTGALIYFDPPYLVRTRTRKTGGYMYEPSEEWHAAAAELLRVHNGPVLVAGYRSALYHDLYEVHGWTRVERVQQTNSGGSAVECLWLSPTLSAATMQPRLK